MQLIPAIDLLNGQAVRLRKGDYQEVTVYSDAPAQLAANWKDQVERLHVVDLEGARAGTAVQKRLIAEIVEAFGPGVQVGGGVRSFESAKSYLELGVTRIVLGTAALREPDWVRELAKSYPERVIVAVDARRGMVATEGWLEQSQTRAVTVVQRFADSPLDAVLYTDIDRDGVEVGPNIPETVTLAREGGVKVIASGGVGTLDHLRELAKMERSDAGVFAVIVGRALHQNRFSLSEAIAAAAGG